MNQNKLIDILESVAPQIVETHDPESVLLKAAADHNMYSAQLEKTGSRIQSMEDIGCIGQVGK